MAPIRCGRCLGNRLTGFAVLDSPPIDIFPKEVRLELALMRKSRPEARIEACGSADVIKLLVAGDGLGMPPRSTKPPITFGVC